MIQRCRENIDNNMTEIRLKEYLNKLWLDGKILRFLDDRIEINQLEQDNFKKSNVLHRELLLVNNFSSVRSRTSEIIRLLSINRMRKKPRDGSIATLSYIKNSKKIPERNISILEFKKEIINEIKNGIQYETRHYTVNPRIKQKLILACEIVLDGLNNYYQMTQNRDFSISKFQENAIKFFIRTKYFKTRRDNYFIKFPYNHYILEAGVGSGKTYGFIIGPLIDIFTQIQYNRTDGVNTLILYPRVSLVQDQFHSLNAILDFINEISKVRLNGLKIRFLIEAAGQIKETAGKIKKRIVRNLTEALNICYKEYPHQIVFGTLETIKRRIINPICSEPLLRDLRTIIYDEIHLLSGLQGNHAILFSRRLLNLIEKYKKRNPQISFIGASATIANPIFHASKIFGMQDTRFIKLIKPIEDELIEAGIDHHVMLKSFKGSNLNAVLTNMTSLIIHNRRNGLKYEFEDSTNVSEINKTIFFADSLNVIGRMNFLIKDNEFADISKFEKPGFPFYSWFFEPLSEHEMTVRSNKPIFPQLKNLCKECKAGKKFSVQLNLNNNTIKFLSNLKSSQKASKEVGDIYDFLKERKEIKIGPLDECFYFNFGCCWWFSQDSHQREEIFSDPKIEYFSGPIKCTTLTSGSEEDYDSNIASIDDYFKSYNYRIYLKAWLSKYPDYRKFFSTQSNLNLLIASPKIEVGVDFRNVKEGIGFKAIRNLAAYHQKMGRIGREPGSDSLLISLLSFRPEDHYYFRNNFKLTNTEYLDPIPLKSFNKNVISSQLFMAIFDFLLTENIPNHGSRLFLNLKSEAKNYSSLPVKVKAVKEHLIVHENNRKLFDFLINISPNPNLVEKAIFTFYEILDLLLYNISLVFNQANLAQTLQFRKFSLTPQNKQDLINSYKKIMDLSKERLNFNLILLKPQFTKYSSLIKDFFNIFEKKHDINKFNEIIINFKLQDEISSFGNELRTYKTTISAILAEDPLLQDELLLITNLLRYLNILNIEIDSFNDFLTIFTTDKSQQEQIFNILLNIFPLVTEYNDIFTSGEGNLKLSYFCDFFSSLNSLNKYYPFVFHHTLFQSPTIRNTKVIIKRWNQHQIKYVPSYMVFYDLLPSSWNYRFGFLLKFPSYNILINDYHYVSLDRIIQNTESEFDELGIVERVNFPDEIPTQIASNHSKITIYFPKTIELHAKNENPFIIKSQSLVMDDDDIPFNANYRAELQNNNDMKRLKTMPTSFPLYWYHIIFEKPTTYSYKLDLYSQEYNKLTNKAPSTTLSLPSIFEKLFNSIEKSNHFTIKKYVWAISRSYGDRELQPFIIFYKKNGNPAFIGDQFESDGLIFNINRKLFEEFWENLLKNEREIRQESLLSQLTIQTIYSKILKSEAENPFEADLLLQIVLYAYLDLKEEIKVKPNIFLKMMEEIDNEYVTNLINIFNSYRELVRNPDDIKEKVLNLKDKFINSEFTYVKEIKDRAYFLFLHTLSHKILSAAKLFLGVAENNINYFFSVNESKIFLFDNVEGGNGSCETLFQYLYIPKIARRFNKISKSTMIYPSSDFLNQIEENLQECSYSQSGKISFDLSGIAESIDHVKLPPILKNLEPDIRLNYKKNLLELIKELKKKYNYLTFEDLYLVQKVPLFFKNHFSLESNIEKLEGILDVCTVGCIECIIDTFSCIFGFINMTERINSNLLNMLYFNAVASDSAHYGISKPDPESFNKIHLMGKDENPSKPSITFYTTNRNNQIITKNYRFLKKNILTSYLYINKGEYRVNGDQIIIIPYILRKIEGERIKL